MSNELSRKRKYPESSQRNSNIAPGRAEEPPLTAHEITGDTASDGNKNPISKRFVFAGGEIVETNIFVATEGVLISDLLSHRLGVDHLHDLPYPELTQKEQKRVVLDRPPLLLRREEVYVAALKGLMDGICLKKTCADEKETTVMSTKTFISEVDAVDSKMNIARVFYHYWKKGLVISPATKFGGHFMLYESDRDQEHVCFTSFIVCVFSTIHGAFMHATCRPPGICNRGCEAMASPP